MNKKYEKNSIIILPYGYVMTVTNVDDDGKITVAVSNGKVPYNVHKFSNLSDNKIDKLKSAVYNGEEAILPTIISQNELDEKEKINNTPEAVFIIKEKDSITLLGLSYIVKSIDLEKDTVILISNNGDIIAIKFSILESMFKSGQAFFLLKEEEEKSVDNNYLQVVDTNLSKEDRIKIYDDSISDLIEQLQNIRSQKDIHSDSEFKINPYAYQVEAMRDIIDKFDQIYNIDYGEEGEKLTDSIVRFFKNLTVEDKETWYRELRIKLDDLITKDISIDEEDITDDEDIAEIDVDLIVQAIDDQIEENKKFKDKILSIIEGKNVTK